MFITFLILFVLAVFLGEELMLFVGAMIHIEFLPLWRTFFIMLSAVYFGDFLFFYLGYHYGDQLIEKLINKKLIKRTKVEKIKGIFERGGTWILFVSKFAYGLNHLTQLVAGVMKFDVKKYIKNQLVVSLAWVVFYLFIGYTFSAVLSEIFFDIRALSAALLLVFAAIFALGWVIDRIISKIFPK
ncbi:MAG: DedA family protein [Minisyncoccia bacterium]